MTSQHHQDDEFQARPSNRMGRNAPGLAQADGSTWQEYLAVCEIQDKLQIRSYFQNQTTGKRVWDEPPSGASHIIPANEEMRRMANIQLQELRISTNGGGIDGESQELHKNSAKVNGEKRTKTGLKSLFGLARKQKSDDLSKQNRKILYKPGSVVSAEDSSAKSNRIDPHLQQAIAQSIAESHGRETADSTYMNYEDPDMAMAMALSLSEATTTATSYSTLNNHLLLKEDEMLRRALELSNLESTKRAAARPNQPR